MATFNVISSIDLRTDRDYCCSRLRKLFVPFFDRLKDWSNKYKIQLFNLDCVRGALGKHHPDSLFDMLGIANTLWHQAKYQEAVALLEEVVEAYARSPPTYADLYLVAMDQLVILLQQSGRFEDAERMWNRTLEEKARLYDEGCMSKTSSHKDTRLLDLRFKGPMKKGLPGELEMILDLIDTT